MLVPPALQVSLLLATSGSFMDCGGAPVCGVLTLETGLGGGRYAHEEPVVHGLWPQVAPFGNSRCVPPGDSALPTALADCYRKTSPSREAALAFEQYEWSKHGVCAGTDEADDYLRQLCSLAQPPLADLTRSRRSGLDLSGMAAQLRAAAFPVWAVDARNSQLELSACAGSDGRWRLADVADFGAACGSDGAYAPRAAMRVDRPKPVPAARPEEAVSCLPSTRGPLCADDASCLDAPGCVRCARTGFCTDQPLRR